MPSARRYEYRTSPPLAGCHSRGTEAPGTSPAKLLATKVLADTLFFQAPFLTLYFGVMGLLEGQTFAKTFEKTKESFHRAWALSLFGRQSSVNLFYVPASWQPFVVSAVNVGWKSTLSLLNQYHTEAAPTEDEIDRELEVAELRADLLALRAQLTFLQVENDDFRRREAERRFSWMHAGAGAVITARSYPTLFSILFVCTSM